MFKILLAATTTLAAAAPAFAQDVSPFRGPRVEGRIGYEFVNSGVRATREFGERGMFGDDASGEQEMLGFEAGYDMQVSGFVVGGYAGVDLTDTTISSPASPYEFDTGKNFTLGVRGGVALIPDVLVYAKGGYSRGKLNEKFLAGSDPALFDGYKSGRNGFHVGTGFEVALPSRFYAKAEYVYSHYKSYDVGTVNELELRFNRHQLLAGAGVRF